MQPSLVFSVIGAYEHVRHVSPYLSAARKTVSICIGLANLTTAVDGGPFVGSGLKPLFPPETHGVTPLADAARRNVSLVAASGAPLAGGEPGPRRN